MADSEELGVAWWQNALATRGALQNHWKYVLSVEAHLYVRPLEPYGSHTGLGVKGFHKHNKIRPQTFICPPQPLLYPSRDSDFRYYWKYLRTG